MSIFTGAGVALVTPMHADGSVNFDKLKELVEFQIANSIDALVICGTTGEASTISDEDQIECVRFAKEVAGGRVPIIAGAGSNSTAHCIELAQACEKAGADAFVTANIKHNQWIEIRRDGFCVLDAGHFCTENTVIEPLQKKLSANFGDAEIIVSEVSEDPARYWAK